MKLTTITLQAMQSLGTDIP